MATGYTALQDLKECPVCKEEFTDPRALPCDHLLCQYCIDHIKRGIYIKCPVCNASHKVSKIRRDFRLMQFLDALKEEKRLKQNRPKGDEPYCQVCSLEDAHYWCKDCRKWLCSGCNRSHLNIPACMNHTTDPLSSKIKEFKTKYQSLAKKIKAKLHNYETAAQNIEDKIDEFEVTQIEALAESNHIRSKCIDDINKYFDAIDDEIMAFIQHQIYKLKGSRKRFLSEMNEIETNFDLLEQMMNENSRKLAIIGQSILDQAREIKNSYSDFKLECDNIIIEVVQGSAWEPSSAAHLDISGNTQIESKSQIGAIAYRKACSMSLGAHSNSPSKPELSSIANNKYMRRKDVDLPDAPLVVRFINNQLLVGMNSRVWKFDLNLKSKIEWRYDALGDVCDVAGLHDKSFVLVCSDGLFHTNGKRFTDIDSGDYRSGVYHNGRLYVYEYDSNSVITYTCNRSWKKQANISSPIEKGFNTLSISDTTITICSNKGKLCIMNLAGQVIHTYDLRSLRVAGGMDNPYLCQEDDDGAMLLVDRTTDRLIVLSSRTRYRLGDMEPTVNGPVSAVYVNGVIYVISDCEKKLYSYTTL